MESPVTAQEKTSSPVLEIVRLVLYFIGLIFGIVVWSVTADTLSGSLDGFDFCAFRGKSSNCDAIIALGVIASLLTVVAIVIHMLPYCTTFPGLPPLAEIILLAVIAAIWFILGCVTAATSRGFRVEEVKVAIAFSWITLFVSLGSVAVAVVQMLQS